MKRNFIFNLITFLLTSFLLVLVVMAWYVSNKEVSANGITGSTAGQDYTLKLERGNFIYDDSDDNTDIENNGGWYWTWTQSNNMVFSDIQPGDAFHFRIEMENKSADTQEFDVAFNQIKSALMENLIEAYIKENLVVYTLSTDTEIDSNTDYYTGVFTADNSVNVGEAVKYNTYYEKIGETNTYQITSDATYLENKTYYKAKFTLDNNPVIKEGNVYYKKGSTPTTKNSIGLKYDTNKYSYLYTLDKTNKVMVDNQVLYSYDSTKNELSLGYYLIQNVFKVHNIGTKNISNNYYGADLTVTDDLYYYNYTQVTNQAFDPKKTYYVDNSTYANTDTSGNKMKVKSMDTSFKAGTTYYTRTTVAKDVFTSADLTSAKFSFQVPKKVNDSDRTYYYFALEFNDAASIVNINGVESSNCYLYQSLTISQLAVNKKQDN